MQYASVACFVCRKGIVQNYIHDNSSHADQAVGYISNVPGHSRPDPGIHSFSSVRRLLQSEFMKKCIDPREIALLSKDDLPCIRNNVWPDRCPCQIQINDWFQISSHPCKSFKGIWLVACTNVVGHDIRLPLWWFSFADPPKLVSLRDDLFTKQNAKTISSRSSWLIHL